MNRTLLTLCGVAAVVLLTTLDAHARCGDMRLAGTFCIPASGSFLDSVAGLPAVGAVSQRGELDLTQVLGLP